MKIRISDSLMSIFKNSNIFITYYKLRSSYDQKRPTKKSCGNSDYLTMMSNYLNYVRKCEVIYR